MRRSEPIDAWIPDLVTGTRAATAIVLPVALSVRHASPEMWWMMLGGWLATLADPRGDRAERARVVCAFAAFGSVIVALGETCATSLALATMLVGAVAFGGSTLRALGAAASSVGTLLTIVAAVAVTRPRADPLHDVIGFVAGCGLAALLSSMLWPMGIDVPERRAAGDALATGASLVRHAIRAAFAASAAEVMGTWLSPRFAAWVTLTAVVVLQPDAGSTIRRVGQRVVGTVLGALAAIAIVRLGLGPLAVSAVLFPLAVAALVARSRSYPCFTFFVTPVFLLVAMQDSGAWWIAFARVGDTLLGCAIALGASVVVDYAATSCRHLLREATHRAARLRCVARSTASLQTRTSKPSSGT